MAKQADIAVVGKGRLGSALIAALKRAGYRVPEIIGRKGKRSITAKVVWFCVPDRSIAQAALELAATTDWKGKVAFHTSGALPSDELGVLRDLGASVAAVHPFMTFVRGSTPALKGVAFGMEGDAAALRMARRIVRDLGGQPFALAKASKPAYHAWGGFTSPFLVALLVAAEQAASQAGISPAAARKKMMPIIRQTLGNYEKFGAAGAFSGPIIRGDANVVRKHLDVLKVIPEIRDLYVALAKVAVKHLPTENTAELEKVLREAK